MLSNGRKTGFSRFKNTQKYTDEIFFFRDYFSFLQSMLISTLHKSMMCCIKHFSSDNGSLVYFKGHNHSLSLSSTQAIVVRNCWTLNALQHFL